jgi:hypothetical protein
VDQSPRKQPVNRRMSLKELATEPYRKAPSVRTSNLSIGDNSYQESPRKHERVSDISPRLTAIEPLSPSLTPRETTPRKKSSFMGQTTTNTQHGVTDCNDDLQTKMEPVSATPKSIATPVSRLSPVSEREDEEEKQGYLKETRK